MTADRPFHIRAADPASDSAKNIADALAREIVQNFGPRDETPFALAAHDDAGAPIGGLNGASHWRWLYIRHLWVAPAWRGRGVGRALLRDAERHAQMRQCVGLYVDTFDADAERLYRCCGYDLFGRIENFPPGHVRRFLSKALDV